MRSLKQYLVARVVEMAMQRARPQEAAPKEARLVFLGPPLELLEDVFELLVRGEPSTSSERHLGLPVLLQVPKSRLDTEGNPPVGASGRCDHAHLLTVRDTASSPSFLALVPPDQHMDLSVATTVDMFGVGVRASTGMAVFDDWWSDAFIQQIVAEALDQLGFVGTQREQAIRLVEDAARAADVSGLDRTSRQGAWRVLSRIFGSAVPWGAASAADRLAAACGAPPCESGLVDRDVQSKALTCIANAAGEGFKAGLERAVQNAQDPEVREAVEEFRAFILKACDIPAVFERAPMAYYSTSKDATISAPPRWWAVLTAERWIELLEDTTPDNTDISLEVVNSISPVVVGGIHVVEDEVALKLTVVEPDGALTEIVLERRIGSGARGLSSTTHAAGRDPISIVQAAAPHKAPIRFIAQQNGRSKATVKVISLSAWAPGVHVQCRTAQKLTPAKQLAKASSGRPTIECALVLEGPGRHLIDFFFSADCRPDETATLLGQDDSLGLPERSEGKLRQAQGGHYSVEVDVQGEADLDISFVRAGGGKPVTERCRVHLTCEEVKVTGCSSEFERLIQENRSVRRVTVQVDRVARCSVLESWMLAEVSAARSWLPVVLGPDYADAWSQPVWNSGNGPLFSGGSFISDPRPRIEDLAPPQRFVRAREAVLRRIRGSDGAGLTAQAQLGAWYEEDASFREHIENLLDSYMEWWMTDPTSACWSDVVAITSFEPGTRTLSPRLDAIALSPLHPIRLAWQCAAQATLARAIDQGAPCPAAALFDPDLVPDIFEIGFRGPDGTEMHTFVAVECSSDYWGVMWNAGGLSALSSRSAVAPFGPEFGLTLGGLARGFSPSQVGKALNDVADLLPAKPVIAIGLTASGTAADSCNSGIADWSLRRFGNDLGPGGRPGLPIGARMLDVFDGRPASARPDEPTLSNLVEDTHGAVRWFLSRPQGMPVDLAIITHLDASQPTLLASQERSAISPAALLRHRVRRQLPYSGQAYLVESRQSQEPPAIGEALFDKLSTAVARIENGSAERKCFRFVPDVGAVRQALEADKADFVAVSSSAVDPGCFVGEWLSGAYLWDYTLPSYSQRAGDVCGSYLISRIKDVDREALQNVIAQLPGGERLEASEVDALLHEVARRGIPTVRELSGDDSRAAGALGMFVAARVLQDVFRVDGGPGGLLPVTQVVDGVVTVTILVPVDPFRAHIDELARATRAGREGAGKRPDLLVVSFQVRAGGVAVRLVPVEVKFRSGGVLSKDDSLAALSQARSLSTVLQDLSVRAEKLTLWRLALAHLLLSMASFGLRIYGQNKSLAQSGREWSQFNEALACSILGGTAVIEIDTKGRLIVVDASPGSGPADRDDDGFAETMVVSFADAADVVTSRSQAMYDAMRARLGDWDVTPGAGRGKGGLSPVADPPVPDPGGEPTTHRPHMPRVEADSTPERTGHSEDGEREGASLGKEASAASRGGGQDAVANPAGVILEIGKTVQRFEPSTVLLNLSDTRLNQLNIGVVGDLGTGKTQLLKSLILQITSSSEANRGVRPRVLIFDYKKDYSSKDFVDAVGAKVVLPYRLPLNLFDTTGMVDSMVPWLDRFKFFSDVLDKIFSGIGPVQRDKLKQAVRKSYEVSEAMGRMPTLYDVHAEYKTLLNGKSDAPLAIIDDLVDSEVFSREPTPGASFANFFDGVVVVSLAALGQDDRSKNMVVAILLNMFYEHMLSIPKRPFLGADPQLRAIDSYLLVDEADNIMQYEFDVLRKLLLQGREFGVGVVLASQYLRHFKVNATDYREPLLTWFIHKVPNVTASELSGLGLTADVGELAERIKAMPNHQMLFKTYGPQPEVVRGLPFFELVARLP